MMSEDTQWLVSSVRWVIYADDAALVHIDKWLEFRKIVAAERSLREAGKARCVPWDEFLQLNSGVQKELIAQRLEALDVSS
jgi:hypothetical protein